MIELSVTGRQELLAGDALTQLNISSRSSQNTLLMPTDDAAEQHQDAIQHDVVMKPSDLMYVAMPTQQPVVHEPSENVVTQLNIRQRAGGMGGEVNQLVQMTDLEVRQQCTTTEQSELDLVAKILAGTVTLSGELADWDSDELQKLLNQYESFESVLVTSNEAGMGDTVVQNGQQNQVLEEPMVSSVVPSLSSTAGMNGLALYSPSPHISNTQSSIAVQSPLSPTSVAFQQLTIDNASRMDLAVSGSVEQPIHLICHIPPQVHHVYHLAFSISIVLYDCCSLY